jgi:sterol desaturase/sphingolipid hydroxylase (fatty acid hydroxylase superfamily)
MAGEWLVATASFAVVATLVAGRRWMRGTPRDGLASRADATSSRHPDTPRPREAMERWPARDRSADDGTEAGPSWLPTLLLLLALLLSPFLYDLSEWLRHWLLRIQR